MRAWVPHGIDRGLKPATTNVTVAALKFFYAETLGCPGCVAGLRARKKPRKLPRYMADEEVERIILATLDLRYRAAIGVAYGDLQRCPEPDPRLTAIPQPRPSLTSARPVPG